MKIKLFDMKKISFQILKGKIIISDFATHSSLINDYEVLKLQ